MILNEFRIKVYTLNHFIKKKDMGGNLAILKNINIYINWKFRDFKL